jgi:hypothetical protein
MDLRPLIRQLQKERNRARKELQRMEEALTAIEKIGARDVRLMGRKLQRGRRKLSAYARRRIAAAQKKRWQEFRAKRREAKKLAARKAKAPAMKRRVGRPRAEKLQKSHQTEAAA